MWVFIFAADVFGLIKIKLLTNENKNKYQTFEQTNALFLFIVIWV